MGVLPIVLCRVARVDTYISPFLNMFGSRLIGFLIATQLQDKEYAQHIERDEPDSPAEPDRNGWKGYRCNRDVRNALSRSTIHRDLYCPGTPDGNLCRTLYPIAHVRIGVKRCSYGGRIYPLARKRIRRIGQRPIDPLRWGNRKR